MIEIKEFQEIPLIELRRIADGYTSDYIYEIFKDENIEQISFQLKRKKSEKQFIKHDLFDPDSYEHYVTLMGNGFCMGVYDKNKLIGFCIAEPESWNSSLWVWEFHICHDYQRQGIGRKLMVELEKKAVKHNLRIIICETQNTNVPAIDFYRKCGFELDGLDLSYYSNEDVKRGEIAVFMKKKI